MLTADHRGVDVVYVVGTGSKWDHNELRYSLRSLARHVSGVRDVWIVGHRPEWCSARHVPARDLFAGDKDRNITAKILAACGIDGLSETFIVHSDDHYWLADTCAACIPLYRRVSPLSHKAAYQSRLDNSEAVLREVGVASRRFDVHAPMPVRRSVFAGLFRSKPFKDRQRVLWKVLYGSMLGMDGEPFHDLKAGEDLDTYEKIHEALDGRSVFSTGPSLVPAMRAYLQWRYPDPSPWEKSAIEILATGLPANPFHRPGKSRGVLTAANEAFFPCLDALVRSVREQGYPITVADHGLSVMSVDALCARGAEIMSSSVAYERSMEDIIRDHDGRISAPAEAWWKPLVCRASPYDRTLWIDADAICLRGLDEMFDRLDLGPILTRDWWIPLERVERLYGPLLRALYGDPPANWERNAWVNTGVIGWRREDAIIENWAQMCHRITSDPDLLGLCKCRDQSGMAAVLGGRDGRVNYMEDWRWNYPAHGLMARNAADRPKCPKHADLLDWARAEHPRAYIAHWLGKHKAWGMS